jgi:tripartite-type tricarboxylate transporter receptor subunit TctC
MLRFAIAIFLIIAASGHARAQTPFYKGKTITIVVGTKAGDAYDLYPRMLAEFMPKYIPGNPNFIIQNVPVPRR